jgi:hypothetical protein
MYGPQREGGFPALRGRGAQQHGTHSLHCKQLHYRTAVARVPQNITLYKAQNKYIRASKCMYVCIYVYNFPPFQPLSLTGKSEWRRVRISGTPMRPRRDINIFLMIVKGNSFFSAIPSLPSPSLQ